MFHIFWILRSAIFKRIPLLRNLNSKFWCVTDFDTKLKALIFYFWNKFMLLSHLNCPGPSIRVILSSWNRFNLVFDSCIEKVVKSDLQLILTYHFKYKQFLVLLIRTSWIPIVSIPLLVVLSSGKEVLLRKSCLK